jgi:hypothetical protein
MYSCAADNYSISRQHSQPHREFKIIACSAQRSTWLCYMQIDESASPSSRRVYVQQSGDDILLAIRQPPCIACNWIGRTSSGTKSYVRASFENQPSNFQFIVRMQWQRCAACVSVTQSIEGINSFQTVVTLITDFWEIQAPIWMQMQLADSASFHLFSSDKISILQVNLQAGVNNFKLAQ